MSDFIKEVKQDYPDWLSEQASKAQGSVIFVKSRMPLYVAPLIITLIALCFHLGWTQYRAVDQNISGRVAVVEHNLSRVSDKTHLIGILHNENFSAAAQGGRFIYIEKDWTIKEMPRYIMLDDQLRETIKEKFLAEPTTDPSTDSSVVQPQNNCQPGCQCRPFTRFFHRCRPR